VGAGPAGACDGDRRWGEQGSRQRRLAQGRQRLAIQSKAQLGTLPLAKPLRVLRQEEQAMNGCRVLPGTLDPLEQVYALDSFPLHHRDPCDRLRIAQAPQEGLTGVTHAPQFSAYALPVRW